MTGWTEGPWRVNGPDDFGDYNILHSADALAIAAVVWNGRDRAEVRANAHLIAAAPELYEALAELLGQPTFGEINGATGSSPFILDWGDIREARAALAKARGETP